VTDHPDHQRIRPTREGQARLLAAIEMVGPPHVVDSGTLGEYAELVAVRGRAEADALLPDVAAHLADGCATCADDLRDLIALAETPDTSAPPEPPLAAGAPPSRSAVDSGIHAADLPDPHAAESAEPARRQRRHRLRDRLLIGVAIAILLVGLSLIALAYRAGSQPGRAAPAGMNCPASHPIKGNRSSMIYHQPGGEFYAQTRPEDCFASPADAEAAGYRASLR